MKWRSIRLELAPSAAFPLGSPSRAYLLCLPLKLDGSIDEKALPSAPVRARVRRFWPNQPDMSGVIILVDGGLGFAFEDEGANVGIRIQPQGQRFLSGGLVVLAEPDGSHLSFTVAHLQVVC
jgi:hypothetical protein